MAYRFVANVNLIFLTQAANRLLAFVISVILARGLGPEARGDYALFVLSVTLAGSLGTLGASLGTMYYVGKGTRDLRDLLGGGHFLVLVMGALVAIALACLGLAFEPKAFVEGRSFWLYALAFPLVLEFVLVTAVLVGGERFLAFNLTAVSQAVVLLLGAIVLWVGGWLTIFSVLSVWVFSYALASALALAYIGLPQISVRRALRPDMAVLKDQLGFGLPGQVGMVLQRLNYRLDQYVVRAYRTRADVGFYAVATGLAEAVWWIANAISLALLPRLTRMSSERAGTVTPVACRNTLVVSLLAAGGLAASAPLAVDLLFGSAFEPAVNPILWLLPGVVAFSGSKVLNSYFFSQARMGISSIVALISLVVTVVLDVLLIPEFGISGAAMASSVAYATSFAASLYFYQRISGNDPWSCLLPKAADVELYLDLARRLRRTRSIAAADGTVPPA